MVAKKKAAAGGRQIFKRSDKIGATIALDLAKAEAIEHVGGEEFIVYIFGRPHNITSAESLNDLAGRTDES